MKPEELAGYLRSLDEAAEVVEAIDDRRLQRRRGWDLSDWRDEPVPWGVRFVHQGKLADGRTEVLVMLGVAEGRVGRLGGGDVRVVLSSLG